MMGLLKSQIDGPIDQKSWVERWDGSLLGWGFGAMIDRNYMITFLPFLFSLIVRTNHKYFILKKEPNHICHL